MDIEPNDPIPALQAQIDQLTASLGMMAELFGSYYQHLLDAGLPEDLAHEIALDYAENFQSGLGK